MVPVDGAKVERIVENLLANTVRHTPSDLDDLGARVCDRGRRAPAVEDDGPGVAPDLRDTIFEPFRQGPDAPRHSPGVGVGLTLVRRFAELHGGSRVGARSATAAGPRSACCCPTTAGPGMVVLGPMPGLDPA